MTTEQIEELEMLRESVQRFVQQEYDADKRQRRLSSPTGVDPAIWRSFADLGWLAAPFAESVGGLGGGPAAAAIIMEGIGKALVLEPFLPSVIVAGELLVRAGTPAQRDRYLPALMSGDRRLAVAYNETQSRFDLADCETTARKRGADFVLSGRKSVVLGGPSAGSFIVVARTSGLSTDPSGITLFLVDRDTPGLSFVDYPTIDGLRACDVVLNDVAVTAANVLGNIDQGLPLLDAAIDHGIAAIASEAVGAMSALLGITIDYMKQRKQFGHALSSNQALQHRLVDMYIPIEESRAMAGYAVQALGESNASARNKAVSAVKMMIGKAARLVGQEAIQMHGGMGITMECLASHYFRRLTMIGICFGDDGWHEQRFAAI